MSSADRRKPSVRHPAPVFDRLEERTLLTVSTSPVPHYAFVRVYAEVTNHAAVGAAATHSATTVHADVATHYAVKPAHAAVKPAPTAQKVAKTSIAHTALAEAIKIAHAALAKATQVTKAAVVHPFAFEDDGNPAPNATKPVSGSLQPLQVQTAYGLNLLPNKGQGVTVDIIDVFHVPTITADLATFSTTYGLPQMNGVGGDPTFTIVSQPGTPNSPSDGSSSDTSLETALDVEWVHAIAPFANIILQEVNSFSYNDGVGGGLLPGVHNAASTPGVVAVSVSYGSNEFNGQTGNDALLAPVAGNPNAISFSTGDSGTPSYPATSPQVLAVGGTGLYIASARGRYQFETAWGGVPGQGAGGGGVSAFYGAPTFQSSNGVNFSGRAIPDISAVADPLTAVSVINSWDNPGSPWTTVGGTSLATPVVSGMIALAQQTRINSGLLPLTSPQINAKIYATYNSPNYSTDFHDIVVGNNSDPSTGYVGFSAITGYDRATGVGSPIGNQFVSMLDTP
jgi:subtilase family serine protease